jgi:hypothetical protein
MPERTLMRLLLSVNGEVSTAARRDVEELAPAARIEMWLATRR